MFDWSGILEELLQLFFERFSWLYFTRPFFEQAFFLKQLNNS